VSATWLHDLAAEGATRVRVSVIAAAGSSPNQVGSAMTVGTQTFSGTIGGGTLELEALKQARRLLDAAPAAEPWFRLVRDFPLGPALGQCCGGHVKLLFETVTAAEAETILDTMSGIDEADLVLLRSIEPGRPILAIEAGAADLGGYPPAVSEILRDLARGTRAWSAVAKQGWWIEPACSHRQVMFLYGAGHVGRAVVHAFQGLPFDIYWVDTDASRYPEDIPAGVERMVSANPADAARLAPGGAWHVVMTYSHAIDFDVCQAVLARGDFKYLGVIASATKRQSFQRRLRDAGIKVAMIARMMAPIGLEGLEGKEPAVIAVSLAADFMFRLQQLGTDRNTIRKRGTA
jgi:xanthine dehydrogenase accessory factor